MAALGFAGCSMPSYDGALHALRTWMDSWAGIGRVAVGIARQGYDLQLTRYDERGWRAAFHVTGIDRTSYLQSRSLSMRRESSRGDLRISRPVRTERGSREVPVGFCARRTRLGNRR